MDKSRKRIDEHDLKHPNLFDMVVKVQQENAGLRAGGLNINMEFSKLFSSYLKTCSFFGIMWQPG